MIDLRSDTVTRPTAAMRDAARDAEVGDDKRDGDPTVRALETRLADRLGMEAAVFVPSGTMGNQIAVRTHTDPGEEVLLDRRAHVYVSEFAGLAQFSHLQTRTLSVEADGCPTPEAVRRAHAERSQWPGMGLLVLENTHNKRGGVVADPEATAAAADAAHDLGMAVHLDGARLANAAVALDRPIEAFTREMDSVMFDLSKGLGAPVGAVLAGDEAVIADARNHRNAFGGGMRQAGVLAAAGLEAIEDIERLADDHENAGVLADRLADETGLEVQPPETNIVLVDTRPTGMDAEQFLDRCAAADVLAGSIAEYTVRFVTHCDVSRSDVDAAADRIREALRGSA